MSNKIDIKGVLILFILGYSFSILFNLAEELLVYLNSIIFILFKVNPKVYLFKDIISPIIILLFLIIIIFKYLKEIDLNFNISIIPKRIYMMVGILILIVFLMNFGLLVCEGYLLDKYPTIIFDVSFTYKASLRFLYFCILFLKFVVILIALIKIYRNSTVANK